MTEEEAGQLREFFHHKPTSLYDALKAEGFDLPNECGDVKLVMPVDGVFQLHYVVNLTADDLTRIGKAFVRMCADKEGLVAR